MFMQLGYGFHKNCFDLWLAVNSMSVMNAEKTLEYTQNCVYLVKALGKH